MESRGTGGESSARPKLSHLSADDSRIDVSPKLRETSSFSICFLFFVVRDAVLWLAKPLSSRCVPVRDKRSRVSGQNKRENPSRHPTLRKNNVNKAVGGVEPCNLFALTLRCTTSAIIVCARELLSNRSKVWKFAIIRAACKTAAAARFYHKPSFVSGIDIESWIVTRGFR